FRSIRAAVYALARRYEQTKTAGATRLARFEIVVEINQETGQAQIRQGNWWLTLLKADLSRLRVCEICESVFWARQDNMYACNPRCSNARRQRKLRENRSQYEEARKRKKRRSAKAGEDRK